MLFFTISYKGEECQMCIEMKNIHKFYKNGDDLLEA